MTYEYTPQACGSGPFLDYLDGVTREAMVRVFGTPPEGYWDPDSGYDGEEWYFTGEGGEIFFVYARWGNFRVGGMADPAPFKAWLRARLGLA